MTLLVVRKLIFLQRVCGLILFNYYCHFSVFVSKSVKFLSIEKSMTFKSCLPHKCVQVMLTVEANFKYSLSVLFIEIIGKARRENSWLI